MLSPALNILTSFCLCKINPQIFSFCRPRLYRRCWLHCLLQLVEDDCIQWSQQETVSSFDWQPLRKSELLFGDGIKEGRGIRTKTGFVSSGPPWGIIGLHPSNVRHDALVWSRILPSPILFEEVTTTSMMHLKVIGTGMSQVRSRILPSRILFKRWQRWRTHAHWMTFWCRNLPLSERLWPCKGVGLSHWIVFQP